MPEDKKIDLSNEIDEMLQDVRAATEEVKQQQDARSANERETVRRAKTRKLQTALVAIGAIVVLLISYWIVFAKPGNPQMSQTAPAVPARSQSGPGLKVVSPTTAPANRGVQPPPTSGTVGRDAQVADHPPDDYEQPSQPGM